MIASQPSVDLVTSFFAALAARDTSAVQALWHGDGQVSAAFDPTGNTLADRQRWFPYALHLSSFFKNYDQIAFRDIIASVADDGRTIWVETSSELRVGVTQTPYCNRYVFKFSIEDGRIKRLVEYANTVTQNLHGHSAAVARAAKQ